MARSISSAAHRPNEVRSPDMNPRRAVEVGVRDAHPARGQRLERLLDRGQPGDGQRPHRGAVIGDLPAEHLVPARLTDGLEVLLGQLPGRLDRLGAAGGEEHPVQVARGQPGQPFGQLDRARMGVRPEREVGQLGGLPGARLGNFPAAVPDLADEQAGQAVQVALALLVVHVLAFAAHDHRQVGIGIGRHPGEVQPQVAPRGGLEREVGWPARAEGAVGDGGGADRVGPPVRDAGLAAIRIAWCGHLVPQP